MKHPKLIATFLVLFSLCIYLFYSTYEEVEKKTIDQLNLQQMVHARQAANGIQSFFDHYRNQLSYLARLDDVAYLSGKGEEILRLFYESNRHEILAVSLVDSNGIIQFYTPCEQSLIGRDLSERDHIKKITQTHKPVISDVFTSILGFQCVAMHVPIFEADSYRGSLAILVSFEYISKKFLEGIKIGNDGYAWMISQAGIELYCPVPDHVGHSVFENCKDFPSILTMAEEMIKGREGITTYDFHKIRSQSIQTREKHAVYLPIWLGDTFWSIVVATPENEVLGLLEGFRSRWSVLILSLLVVAGVASYYFLRAFLIVREEAKRREVENALRASEKRLRSLARRLFSAQEEERKRIATELHDSIGSSLSAVKFSLEAALQEVKGDGAMTGSIKRAVSLTQHTIDESRRIMTNLRPSLLDDVGLIVTIGWLLKQYRSVYSQVYIEEEITLEEAQIPENLKIIIFRIIQEALHNIIKYSQAELVEISLVARDGRIELSIEDNGAGFDVDAVLNQRNHSKGIGLTNMKERAELSNGDFRIASVIGEGTTIRASWLMG